MKIWNLCFDLRVFPTHAEARRLFHQGFVRLDGEVIRDIDYIVPDGVHFIKIGKSREYRVELKNGFLTAWSRVEPYGEKVIL